MRFDATRSAVEMANDSIASSTPRFKVHTADDDVLIYRWSMAGSFTMKRGSRAWKKHGKQRWKWRKKKLRRRKRARRQQKQ